MNNTVKWSIAGSVLILALALAMVPSMLKAVNGESAEVTETSVEKQVAQRPDCPGQTVAGVALPCLGGESGQSTGKPTVVNVWAWWCAPCREELPLFDALANKHPEWSVVGVHADRNAANGAAMLNDLGIDRPSYQDDANKFGAALNLPGVVPITIVVRADGTVAKTFPKTFQSEAELEAAIEGALHE